MRPKACDMPLKDKYNRQWLKNEEFKYFHPNLFIYCMFQNLNYSVRVKRFKMISASD